MVQRRKASVARVSASERAMRDQEVIRANRELAAYFKGRRTEREARAALKIIKAFVRERERLDASRRPPLPGGAAATTPNQVTHNTAASGSEKRRKRKARGTLQVRSAHTMTPSSEIDEPPEAPPSPDER